MIADTLRAARHILPEHSFGSRPQWAESGRLIALAAPLAAAALVNMGMSVTDTVMMGWLGPVPLAAGAVVSDLYSIVFYFLAGILSMVTPLIARAIGGADPVSAGRSMRTGLAAAFIVSVPAFLLVWHCLDFLNLIGVEENIREEGRGYARAMAFTIVPMLFVTLWRNLFGAIGRPRLYLIAILAALPANAVANAVLMFGLGPLPPLHITGAGIASALVAFGLLGGFLAFSLTNAGVRRLCLFERPWRVNPLELAEIFRLGLPVGFFTLGEVGIFLLATVFVSLFGAEALVAHAITLRIAGIAYAIPVGLSQAATIRVSHAIGRGDHSALRISIRSARLVGALSGLLIFAVLVSGADVLPSLFFRPETVAVPAAVGMLLLLLGLLNLAQGFAGPATAILRGFKETRIPMVLCLAGYWAVGMPYGVISAFVFGQGAFGIWCGLALGVVATALFMNLRLAGRDIPVSGV